MEPRVVRRIIECVAVDGERLFVASLAAKRTSFPVERFHPIGTLRERAFESVEGGLPTPLPGQRTAQVECGLGVIGCEGKDAPEALFRLCRPVEAKQHHALVEVRIRRVRFETACLAIGGESRFEVGALLEHEPEMQVTGGRTRARRDRTTEEREGLR